MPDWATALLALAAVATLGFTAVAIFLQRRTLRIEQSRDARTEPAISAHYLAGHYQTFDHERRYRFLFELTNTSEQATTVKDVKLS